MPEVKNLPVGCLYEHPDNPRKALGDLTELADNIKANGIFQNLMVVPAIQVSAVWNEIVRLEPPPDEAYVVIIGHRRLAAAKLAGLTEVPCAVVSLSPTEQIATMLEENMHRSDLNVYEKTHGFQMMLDLGETVDSIVKKRGFKESTVRRHLKFTVFEDQTFREATEKQITMDTLSEVAKIEDAKKRDKVLASYGSNNFQWDLRNAVESQEAKKRRPEAKKEILAYAKEVEHVDYARCDHVLSVEFAEYTPGSATPQGGAKGEFVVVFGPKMAFVYKKKKKAPASKRSEEELARERETKHQEETLTELTATAYSLRRDFLDKLVVTKSEYALLLKHAGRALVASNINYWGADFARKFADAIGVEAPKSYIPAEFCERLLAETGKYGAPDRPVIEAIAAAYGDKKTSGYWWKAYGGITYKPNNALDYLYDFLQDFGYVLSDMEQVLKDGTHPLLAEKKPGDAS